MNVISRTITGIIVILFGLFLVWVSLNSSFWILIEASIAIVIGVVILFNKNEDRIEGIKSERRIKK